MDDHHLHSQRHHPIQFQLPQFVYSSAPTLVPGGGAEVIPLTNPEWFVNNGFTLSPGNHFFAQQQPPALNDHVGESTSSPFDFAETEELTFPPPAPPTRPDLHLLSSLSVPSPFGLPVYSVSGFDIVSILSRVHHRPNATVHLGPVDLTCSFVVVDPRRYDHPIVYCSPTFCTLTGYAEAEVLGRNCRFLQAPGGMVAKGEQRKFTSGESVGMLRKAIASGKDVQTSIVNYKKNGAAFINLVTVITVNGEGEEGETPWYYVGFQVDLTEQPNAILEKLRDGTYAHFEPPPPRVGGEAGAMQNGGANSASGVLAGNARDKKGNAVRPVIMSKELKRLLADPSFLRSFPLPHDPSSTSTSTSTTTTSTSSSTEEPTSANANAVAAAASANHLLHLFLLEASPDFIHVVSLKGSFLYVAPSVRRVLGYEAHEMVGRCLADYAHPEDVVPLMRELKESSATGIGAGFVGGGGGGSNLNSNASGNHNANGNGNANSGGGELQTVAGGGTGGMPRSVDLLFRAKTKMGRYVWVECRGRLHVEPGKGRKAIILTGRAREMMSLRWEDVREAGGLARSVRASVDVRSPAVNAHGTGNGSVQQGQERREERREVSQEVWGLLGGTSRETATFLTAGVGMRDVLGWTAEEVVGRGVRDFVVNSAGGADAGAEGMEGIGAVVNGMRVFQRERRWRGRAGKGKGKGKEAGDPARWRKVRCLMRTRDGGCVDVWFVVYRADLEDESGDRDQDLEGTHDGEEKQGQGRRKKVHDEAGMSISPAALVYQIRRADAETVECGPMPPTTEAALGLGGGGVSSSSSSTKNAASFVPTTSSGPAAAGSSSSPSSSSSSSSAAVAEQTRPAPVLPTPSLDMFEELSIARGTSWQYELQQLRFANARLEEEIAGLEAVVADVGDAKRRVRKMERGNEMEKGNDKEELKQERVGVESIQTAANASVNVNVEYVPYEEPSYADVAQQQQQQQLFSRGQLVVHQHQQQQPPQDSYAQHASRGGLYEALGGVGVVGDGTQQPPQDSYAQHASRGGLYEALGGVGVVGDGTVAEAGSGREEATGATAYLHQPKPQYSLGGRTVLPLALQREREREQRYTSSSLQYTPQQQQQQQLQQQLHNYQLSPLQQHREISRAGSHAQARPQAHTHTLPRPQPQTWGTMTVPPLQLQSPMLIYSRHSNPLHRQQDMDMDMDVESMYAAVGAGADAGGASGMSPAVGPPGAGAGLSSGSSLVPPNTNASSSWNSSLKRSWSAVGS
ncbi:hypothetical protein CVT25_009283 [Psilocybe cyanescens]|uniref:PAS domain-containing protein n=1 Tax=Psilocybe cyanescens TaxID=93625 RepID=A0A409WW88_PSICY|nr:hypothetical protein CVT25_009283 [Psilocybe cyanescens]